MTITDTLTERRVTRIITATVDTPYKYEYPALHQKGWAVRTWLVTEDGTGPYAVTEHFRLKRDAVAHQRAHLDGTTPKWEMTVTTDANGKAILWTEAFGMRFKG